MKHKILIAAFALLALAATVFPVHAQNPTPPIADTSSFIQSIQGYFTSFDTKSTTFVNRKFDTWGGVDYVQHVDVSSEIGFQYEIKNGFSAESVTRNAGIGGVILSEQAGVGYNKVVFDLKLTAFADGGYNFDSRNGYFAFGVRAKKALTKNTYFGAGIEADLSSKNKTKIDPLISVITGFTF